MEVGLGRWEGWQASKGMAYWFARGVGLLVVFGPRMPGMVLGLMCRLGSVGETVGLLGHWVWSGVRLGRLGSGSGP